MPNEVDIRWWLGATIVVAIIGAYLAAVVQYGVPRSRRDAAKVAQAVGIGFGLGFASGGIPLVLTYFPTMESYDPWISLGFWVAPFFAGLYWGKVRPEVPWAGAVTLELGFLAVILADIIARISLNIPTTVWPLALMWILPVSTAIVVSGVFLGRATWRFFGGRGV